VVENENNIDSRDRKMTFDEGDNNNGRDNEELPLPFGLLAANNHDSSSISSLDKKKG